MSLFRKAGEQFEKTKRSVMGGKQSEYVCRSCEEPVDDAYKTTVPTAATGRSNPSSESFEPPDASAHSDPRSTLSSRND